VLVRGSAQRSANVEGVFTSTPGWQLRSARSTVKVDSIERCAVAMVFVACSFARFYRSGLSFLADDTLLHIRARAADQRYSTQFIGCG
jgi:hypothetical protein